MEGKTLGMVKGLTFSSKSRLQHGSDGGGGLVTKSCPPLVMPWTVAHQALLSIGFSGQEY